MSLLEAKHITKEYDGRTIIKDICIHLEQGELVCLLGLSGSGKTTLFHVLSGLTVPEEGQVLLNGRDITGKPGSVSYMLQKDLLLPHKKVIDNAALPLVLGGMRAKEARKIADPLFDEFGLEGCQDQYPASLSGGMRQRAAFLRTYLSAFRSQAVSGSGWSESGLAKKGPNALNRQHTTDNSHAGGDSKILVDSHAAALLDEPFSALDTITKDQIHAWYLDVMQKIDLSTLFITHDIDEAILLSDRIYLMTGSPGVIRHEIKVSPVRHERKDFNLTSQFLDYKRQIIQILEEA